VEQEVLVAREVPLDRVVLLAQPELAGLPAPAAALAVQVELAAPAAPQPGALELAEAVALVVQAERVALRLRGQVFVGMGGDISTVRKSATMGSMRAATTFVFLARSGMRLRCHSRRLLPARSYRIGCWVVDGIQWRLAVMVSALFFSRT
jgi:hypothetical protein